MKKRYFLSFIFLLLFFAIDVQLHAQASACPTVTTGTVAPICSGGCATLNATVQGTLQTNTYTVSSIPYSPYSYTTGTAVLVNIDDVWTPVINLPFCFQFFGNTYSQIVIGSNGLISFDVTLANAYCQWPIGAAIPSTSDPKNSIMAPWHDIDPSIGSTSDTRYATYGTAPCREFVVSWYHIPMFSSSCNSLLATQQIVLHESTNIIDIYIENKPLCSSWNGGYAIEGIQNATGTAAFFVAGRNYPSTWTATNDGKRFMPAGAPNYTLQWTGPSGVVGTTASVTVCPTTTTTYTCTVTNTTCSGNIVVSGTETVTINSGITLSGAQTNVSCYGSCDGSATTSIVSGTGPFTYTWAPAPGGGQGTNTATGLCAGTYTCTVASSTCTTTITYNITQPPQITATPSQTNVTCFGSCNGTASVVAAGGTGTYTYSWSPAPGGGQGTANATGLCAGTYTCTISSPAGCSITQAFTITQPPQITTTPSQTNVTCNSSCNGTATVVAAGGNGTYTYNWTPAPGGGQGTATATGLCAGTYSCVVSSPAGCTATQTYTITQPPAITFTQSQVNVNCNGGCNGTASVVAAGGTGTYTYNWSPAPGGGQGTANATGLCAGTYSCTITSGPATCTVVATFTITQPTALTATSSITQATCGGNNGTATATGAGGSPGYTYSWNTSPVQNTQTATGLTAGSYTCTVTDSHGCTTTVVATVTSTGGITANTSAFTNVTCFGSNNGTATAQGVGGSGVYSYSWNTSPVQNTQTATGLAPGTYTCTVTDSNGCIGTTTVTITQPPQITATQSQTNVTCNGSCNGTASVVAAGGNGTYTYNWSPAPGGGQGTANATGLCAGTYTCTISSPAGCTLNVTFTITQPPAITFTQSQTNVSCNAACDGTASVVAAGGTGTYTYTWSPAPGGGQGTANATGLCAGTYTCTISSGPATCTVNATFSITQPTPVTATASMTQSTCGNPNGTATATGAGGTPGYTYSWNTSPVQNTQTATGLLAGSYTCTVSDSHGCTTTVSITVTNAGSPTATISAFTNVTCYNACNGTATALAAGGAGGYTYSWSPAPGGGQGTANASGLCPGSYVITVSDANGCTATATATITQPSQLTITGTMTPVLCNGGSTGTATVTAVGGTPTYSYAWSPAPGGGQGTPTATGLSAQAYTCTVTDLNGCTATTTITVTQPPLLTTTFSQVNELCNGGNTATATVTPAGGTPTYIYSWSPAPGGGQGTATATGLTAQTYACTITDLNGCSITQSITITEPTALSLSTATTASTCGNANGSATVTITGGTSAYSPVWNSSPSQSGTSMSNVMAGTYIVVVTDANGCVDSATAVITNMGSPTATMSAFTNVTCNGACDGTATLTGAGGTAPYTYNWTPAPGGGQGTGSATGMCPGTYTCTITDANGCTANDTVTITEPPLLTASGTQVDVLCFGNNTGSAAVTAVGGTGTYTYAWSPAPGGGQGTANATGLTAQAYSCLVTDANGCTYTQNFTITEPPQLTIAIAGFNVTCYNACDGQVVVIPGGGTPNYSFNWSTGCTTPSCNNICAGSYTCIITDANGCLVQASTTVTQPTAIVTTTSEVDAHCNQADGSVSANANGGTGTLTYQWVGGPASASWNGVQPGPYDVIITDANGCHDTASVTVNNIAGVTASLSSVTNVTCNGACDGTATGSAVGGTGTLTYAWTPSGGNALAASALCAGPYVLTVTDSAGCSDTIHVLVTEPAALTVTGTVNPAAVCQGQSVTLSANGAGGTPGYQYAWVPMAMAGANVNYTPVASGPATVIITDAHNCVDSAVVNITVNANPVALLSGDSLSGCAPLCVNFTDISTIASGTITGWVWDFGDGSPTDNTQNPNHCFMNPGPYTITLTVTTSSGCTNTIVMPAYINVFANPVAAFSANPQPTTILNPVILFTDSSTNASAWNWSFGDVLNLNATSTLQNPSYEYLNPDCYQVLLEVTSPDGCTDTATQVVCIGPDASIFVPNTFTPNEDGKNEIFMPVGVGLDPEHFEMWIFDRWGNLIYYTDDLNDGWNGKVQGSDKLCQIDTYVWKIQAMDVLGQKHNLIGHVNLIR